MTVNPDYMNHSSYTKSLSSRFGMSLQIQKILIVEDNSFIAQSVKKLIEKIISEYSLDLEVIICYDGIEMIKVFLNEECNGQSNLKLIFTDENMDYMNGSEAIRFIREIERRKNLKRIKLISLTSNDNQNIFEELLKSGADRHFQKPLSKEFILEIFKELGCIS